METVGPYYVVFVRWRPSDDRYENYAGSAERADAAEIAENLMLAGAAAVYLVEALAIGSRTPPRKSRARRR